MLSRLNQLNDTATRARSSRVQKESLYNQVKAIASRHQPRRDSDHRAPTRSVQSAKTKLAELQRAEGRSCSSATATSIRRCIDINAQLAGRAAAARPRDRRRGAVGPQRVRDRGDRGADASPRTSKAPRAKRTDLNRKSIGYSVMEREAKSNREVYQSLLHAREGAARLEPTAARTTSASSIAPRCRAAPMTPSGRRTWLMSAVIGLVAGGRRRARPRLHERHDQDAGGHHAASEAAVPRPGAGGPRRQAPAARLVARAARFRRVVPIAAHVAALEVPGRGHQDHHRHQRAAARRQDDDGGEHRDGAGLRRRARAADRRRHAPARPAPSAAADQRARPVAGADRPGARPRRHPAHRRSRTCWRLPPAARRRTRRSCCRRSG